MLDIQYQYFFNSRELRLDAVSFLYLQELLHQQRQANFFVIH